jgi:2-polyprenyl-3-methyl-5-hydroxy-6-metoxy-1,4-benzoquinol methylase
MTVVAGTLRPCPACGAGESRPAITAGDFMLELGGEFHVRRCGRCGLLFQNPVPSAETLARHYPDSYGPYTAAEMKIGPAVLRELKHRREYVHLESPSSPALPPWTPFWGRYVADTLLLPDFVPAGRLLEIACASGARLSLLRRLGWSRCEGIEFSESAAKAARERGFAVLTGKVEDVLETYPDASLDVVVAGFVMEHLENPFEVVRLVAAKLKPNGQFLFSTLDVESPDFRVFGKYWYNLDLPRHQVFFRERDLRRLVEGSFRMAGMTRIAAPNDYAGSARYRARHAPRPRWIDLALIRLGNRLRPLCLILAWLGQGSRVAIKCRKLA